MKSVHRFMVFFLLFIGFSLCSKPMASPQIRVGTVYEQNFYGQWGLYADYVPVGFLDAFVLKGGFMSSRFLLNGKHKIIKDHLFSALQWYVGTESWMHPYLQLRVGYSSFDRQIEAFDFLDNTSFTCAGSVGLEWFLFNPRWGVQLDLGYEFLQTTVVLPYVITLGVFYGLF